MIEKVAEAVRNIPAIAAALGASKTTLPEVADRTGEQLRTVASSQYPASPLSTEY